VQGGIGQEDHRRDPVFPLREDGQEGQIKGPDHCEAGGQHAHRRWLRSRHHHGPPRQPDPRLFRHPGRQLVLGTSHDFVHQTKY